MADERVEFALKGDHFRFGQFEAGEPSDVAHLVEGDRHGVHRTVHHEVEAMLRPSFSVVTLTLGLLVGFGTLVEAIRPKLPPPAANALAGSGESFLEQAAHQPIDWMKWGPDVFPRARREGRPVLLVVGASWSTIGRWIDANFLADPEMGRYVGRTFVCVRVDGLERPEFLNAFGPYSRLREGRGAGYQMAVLTPSGDLVGVLARTGGVVTIDRGGLMRALILARRAADASVLDEGQLRDENLLGRPQDEAGPDLRGYRRALREAIPRRGHFAIGDWRPYAPMGWRFFALLDDRPALDRSILGAARSPGINLLDGGFFRGSITLPGEVRVETDRVTTLDAEAASALAIVAAGRSGPWRDLAISTALAALQAEGDRLPAARLGTVDRRGRSPRHSFPPARLRATLSGEERDVARTALGLEVGANPQCLPYLAEPVVGEPAQALLRRLREIVGPADPPVNFGLLSVEARVVARTLEAARLLRDPALTEAALARADRLVDFRRGGDWIGKEPDASRSLTLIDRVAAADAGLRIFLSLGRADAYLDGRDALDAVLRSHAVAPGAFALVDPGRKENDYPWLRLPELADNAGESASAALARVLLDYGRAEGRTERGRRYGRVAREILSRLTPEAVGAPSSIAGFMAMAATIKDDAYLVVVGRDAVEEANRLASKWPARLVVPSAGPALREFRNKPVGLYVVKGADVWGPLTEATAKALLPAHLRVP